MNLTNTKRWSEFEDWYIENDYHDFIELHSDESWMDRLPSFVGLKFEFQEGVYRKFIESLNLNIKTDKQYDYPFILKFDNQILKTFRTFQELVEWFFTNS